MSIRGYLPKDYDQVIELFRALPELFTKRSINNIERDLKDCELDNSRNTIGCSVYCRKDNVLGAIIYCRDCAGDKVFELKWLAVKRENWYNGIGYRLMLHAENLLREKARLIIFYTSNTPIWDSTKKFFRKIGYQDVAVIPDFWDDGDDRVVFWKRVKPIFK